jgi:hypothetical protein
VFILFSLIRFTIRLPRSLRVSLHCDSEHRLAASAVPWCRAPLLLLQGTMKAFDAVNSAAVHGNTKRRLVVSVASRSAEVAQSSGSARGAKRLYLQHRRSWLWNTAAANMRIDARRLRPSKTSRRVNAGSTVRLEEMRCWATPSAMHWICMVFPSLAPQWLWGGSAWPNFRSAPRLTMDRVRGLHRVWGLDSMSPFRDLPLPRLPLVSVRCLAQGQGHGVLERRPSRLAPARQSHWGGGGGAAWGVISHN